MYQQKYFPLMLRWFLHTRQSKDPRKVHSLTASLYSLYNNKINSFPQSWAIVVTKDVPSLFMTHHTNYINNQYYDICYIWAIHITLSFPLGIVSSYRHAWIHFFTSFKPTHTNTVNVTNNKLLGYSDKNILLNVISQRFSS